MYALLNVYKPRGMSSHDVIRLLKPLLPKKTRIGHAGTLDPAAEGVLVVCLGPATRLAEIVQEYDKQYETLACLGATSTTDDAEGQVWLVPNAQPPTAEQLAQVVERYVGRIQQVPPAHSAVMVEGQRAYRLARLGQSVQLSARTVTIQSLEVVDYLWPKLRLRVSCTSGTYIRALVRDIGRDLGCGGYCLQIVRKAIGPFTAERAVTPEELQTGGVAPFLLPPAEAFPPQRRILVSPQQAQALKAGRAVKMAQDSRGTQSRNIAIGIPPDMPDAAGATVGVCVGEGELIAVGRFDRDCLRPVKVLVE